MSKSKKNFDVYKPEEKKVTVDDLKKILDTQVAGIIATLDVQIRQDSRFDTLLALRESYHRFHFESPESEPDYNWASNMASEIRKMHEDIRDIVSEITLESLIEGEFVNPCDAMVEFDECSDWNDVLYQSIIFSAVKPYGQAISDLHDRMVDAKSKIGDDE